MGGITKLSFLELIRIKYLNRHKCLDTGLFCPKFSNKSGSSAPYIITVRAGIFKQSMGARNRVGIGLSYRPPGYIGW